MFDNLFKQPTIDVAALQILVLFPLTEHIPRHAQPFFEQTDDGRVFSVSVREREFNVVVLEYVGLDEEVGVRLIDGQEHHAVASLD